MKKIDGEVFSEIIEIINNSDEEVLNKIPKKFMKYLYENAKKDYHANIDFADIKWEEKLRPETKLFLALIYRDYLLTKEERKEIIQASIQENIKEQNVNNDSQDNFIGKTVELQENENIVNNMQLVEKELWIKRIWKRIIRFIKK